MTVMKRVFPFAIGGDYLIATSYQDPMEIIPLQDEDEYEIIEVDE